MKKIDKFFNAVIREMTNLGFDGTYERIESKKVNETLESLLIKPKGSKMATAFHYTKEYDEALKTMSMDELAKQASVSLLKELKDIAIPDIKDLTSYDYIRNKLTLQVINTKRNQTLLADIPCMEKFDLSLVVRVQLSCNKSLKGSVMVNNGHLKTWGVSKEQLFKDAIENAVRLDPPYFKSFYLYFKENRDSSFGLSSMMTPEDEDRLQKTPMFIATNTSFVHGAWVMFLPDFLADISEKFGCDYYILPSSLHECIIVPSDIADESELLEMVCSVNEHCVLPRDFLANSLYFYDAKAGELSLCKTIDTDSNKKDSIV